MSLASALEDRMIEFVSIMSHENDVSGSASVSVSAVVVGRCLRLDPNHKLP